MVSRRLGVHTYTVYNWPLPRQMAMSSPMRSVECRTPHVVVFYEGHAGRVVRKMTVLDRNFHINVANVLRGFQKAAAARQHHPSGSTTKHLPIPLVYELALHATCLAFQIIHLRRCSVASRFPCGESLGRRP